MNQSLLSLAPSDLHALAGALRMGRLNAPFSSLGVRQVLSSEISAAIASNLQEMSDQGISPIGLAASLELLATSLSQRPSLEEVVDVVTTGPEVVGVSNRDTQVVVSDLFRRAERSVMVAGYAVYQGQRVFQALAERMTERPTLEVRMYLDIQRKAGDSTIPAELVKRFSLTFQKSQWPQSCRVPEIYYDPRGVAVDRTAAAALHAKCVVVDQQEVFVSSANFTEAGQHRNIEVGLLLTCPVIAERITGFFNRLVDEARLARVL